MTREEFILNVSESQEALRRFLLALCCGDAALADDLAQESYLKAWLNIDNFRREATFKSWIRKIAFNNFVSYTRRTTHVNFSRFDSQLDSLPSVGKTDDAFKYEFLYNALKLLSEKERASIILYYLEGYDIKEISGILKQTEISTKKILSRGRMHLKDIITANEQH